MCTKHPGVSLQVQLFSSHLFHHHFRLIHKIYGVFCVQASKIWWSILALFVKCHSQTLEQERPSCHIVSHYRGLSAGLGHTFKIPEQELSGSKLLLPSCVLEQGSTKLLRSQYRVLVNICPEAFSVSQYD